MESTDAAKLMTTVIPLQIVFSTLNTLSLTYGNVSKANLYAVRNCHPKSFLCLKLWISAVDNGEWGGPGSCATRLCQCDLALSKCLRHYYCPKKRPVCVSSPFRLLQNLVMVF